MNPSLNSLEAALQSGSVMDVQNSGTRVLQKPGVIDQIGQEVAALGCKRLMVVCGGSTRRGQLFARAMASLGDRVVCVMDRVVEHSSTILVTETAELARAHRHRLRGADRHAGARHGRRHRDERRAERRVRQCRPAPPSRCVLDALRPPVAARAAGPDQGQDPKQKLRLEPLA